MNTNMLVYLKKRKKNKGSFMHARMRKNKCISLYFPLSKYQEIKINGSGPPPQSSFPAQSLFYFGQTPQHFMRTVGHGHRNFCHPVGKPRLVAETLRFREKNIRNSRHVKHVRGTHGVKRFGKIRLGIAYVGTEAHIARLFSM